MNSPSTQPFELQKTINYSINISASAICDADTLRFCYCARDRSESFCVGKFFNEISKKVKDIELEEPI